MDAVLCYLFSHGMLACQRGMEWVEIPSHESFFLLLLVLGAQEWKGGIVFHRLVKFASSNKFSIESVLYLGAVTWVLRILGVISCKSVLIFM